jgi:hypothetical protein
MPAKRKANRASGKAKKPRATAAATRPPRADWSDDDDLLDRILSDGEEVAYQDWDSGGPGAGAGRVSVYRYGSRFCVLHDAGMSGPYGSIGEAVKRGGVNQVNAATTTIWHREKGVTFKRP